MRMVGGRMMGYRRDEYGWLEEGWRVTGEMNEDGSRKDGGLQER